MSYRPSDDDSPAAAVTTLANGLLCATTTATGSECSGKAGGTAGIPASGAAATSCRTATSHRCVSATTASTPAICDETEYEG